MKNGKDILISPPAFLDDINCAIYDHEIFSYVCLAGDQYNIQIFSDRSYFEMARYVLDQINEYNSSDKFKLANLYRMFKVFIAAHDRQTKLSEYDFYA